MDYYSPDFGNLYFSLPYWVLTNKITGYYRGGQVNAGVDSDWPVQLFAPVKVNLTSYIFT